MAHHGDDAKMFSELRELKSLIDQLPQDARPLGFGATGRFPQGHLNDDDEGELALGIAADIENHKVIMNFGKPVAWIGFDKEQAIALAQSLIEKASQI